MDTIRGNQDLEENEKKQVLGAKRTQSIAEVLEEVEVLIDTHFFTEFIGTKSSIFLKRVLENRNSIDTKLFKKTWRTLNCSPKTMKIIREIKENLLRVGRRNDLIAKKRTESKCWCSKTGLPLNAKTSSAAAGK